MNVFSTNEFASNSYFYLLSYNYYYSCILFYQIVNIFSISEPIKYYFCFYSYLLSMFLTRPLFLFISTSLSLSNQNVINTNISQIYSLCLYYFYNLYHYLNITNNVKSMNKKPLQS